MVKKFIIILFLINTLLINCVCAEDIQDKIIIENNKISDIKNKLNIFSELKNKYYAEKIKIKNNENKKLWAKEDCYIYTGPNFYYNKELINKDTELNVIGEYENNFYIINYNNRIFYINNNNLTDEEPKAEEEIIQEREVQRNKEVRPIITNPNGDFYFDNSILYEGVQIEEDYTGTIIDLSEEDKNMIMHMLLHEFAVSEAGAVLVCQVLRDNMLYNSGFSHNSQGYCDVETVLRTSFYSEYASDYHNCSNPNVQNAQLQKNAEFAYNYVFKEGKSAVQHKLMCYGTDAVVFRFNPNLYSTGKVCLSLL